MVAKEKTKDIILEETEEIPEVEETVLNKNKEKGYIERLQRLQAEFENFQKRTEKEKHNNIVNANANLISQLLEVIDSLELSLKNNEDKGVRLIHKELSKILEKEGLKVIETKGKFNPEFHEALMQEESEEDGVILEELQKGYLLNHKLLRASKVKISRSKQ